MRLVKKRWHDVDTKSYPLKLKQLIWLRKQNMQMQIACGCANHETHSTAYIVDKQIIIIIIN